MRYEKILPSAVAVSSLVQKRPICRPVNIEKSGPSFFILGSGRNGSTLLSSMLNQNDDIVVPPEQFFLYLSFVKYRLLNWLDWQDIVKIVFGEAMNPRAAVNWNINLSQSIPLMYDAPKNERSLRLLMDEIYMQYGQSIGKDFKIWGDKTPKNTLYVKHLFKIYPDSKYIFLRRDGRDVVSSYLKGDQELFGKWNQVEHASYLWNNSFKSWDWINKKVPSDRLLVVDYEDLVDNSEEVLKTICEFLGVDFDIRMATNYGDHSKVLGVDNLTAFKDLKKEVNARSVGKWKTRMTDQQVEETLRLIGPNLKRFGYL